jgi:nicotinamidase-related amidase
MLQEFGRSIPDTVQELLREPTALVVWDMQEGIARRATNFSAIAGNIATLAAAARARGIPIVYSQHYSGPVQFEDRVWLRSMARGAGPKAAKIGSPYAPGSQAWQFVPETRPTETDLVIAKNRPSFFLNTPFAHALAANGIDVIVMTGVATDRGVLSTANEARYRGVFVVVAEDAVGTYSDAAQARGIEELRAVADLCTTSEILSAWSLA